jgi:hypothetical protein
MIGKMLELLRDALWAESASALLEPPLFEGRNEPSLVTEDIASLRLRVEHLSQSAAASIDVWVKQQLEDLFLAVGDDGLLEHLRDSNKEHPHRRRGAVSKLASDLLDRKLFKCVAQIKGVKAAQELYDKFHSSDTRRALERQAAEYAELGEGWKVVIWLPKPEMRLK